MMKKTTLLYCFLGCLLLTTSLRLYAQTTQPLPPFQVPGEIVPHEDYYPPVSFKAITRPPAAPVRTMAEWEELQAVAISWLPNTHNEVLTEIVRAAQIECKVFVHCSTQTVVSSAKNYMTSRGVDINNNVEFLIGRSNSIWIRDYGATSAYLRDVDSLVLIDWIYNRARPWDDTLFANTARRLNLPLYATSVAPYDLVNTGGNVMTDGMGTAFSSKLVLRENNEDNQFGQTLHDEAAVDDLMQKFMGVEQYIKMETLPYDGIHHIDMHIKLLDEETLLVGQYPEGVSDGPQIEANIQYVLSKLSAFGRPYRIVRIPMPPIGGQYPPYNYAAGKKYLYPTYVNSLIVNKTILMPKYDQALDVEAQRIFEQNMPGYRVVPILCKNIVYEGGALHCITKEIGATDPLRIVHAPVHYVVQGANTPAHYPISALVQHQSGIEAATLWYTTDSSSTAWKSVPMHRSVHPDSSHYWTGKIPRIEVWEWGSGNVYYYVEAAAKSGKKQVRPLPAPKGWWKFRLLMDVSSTQEPGAARLQMPFPNPASAITCIPVETDHRTGISLQLHDALGRNLHTIYEGSAQPGLNRYFIDAAGYASGVYFVVLQTNGHTVARRLLIRQ
jgi:agmatine deiminase